MTSQSMKQYYTTVYDQAISPCKKYIAAGNNFGGIAVFNFHKLLNADVLEDQNEVDHTHPLYNFKAHDGPIYALETTDTFLISAGTGDILGWSWKDILNKSAKVCWSFRIPDRPGISKPETNSLLLMKTDDKLSLYAGCGDNKVHSFDLVAQKATQTFSGHTDYVHCVAKMNGGDGGANGRNRLWSSGEDGLVLAWDVRRGGEPVHRFEPSKNELCCRPAYGKWIGSMAIDENDEWMICGGGPALSMWHMRSMSCTQTLSAANSCSLSIVIHEDSILSGGTEAALYCWNFSGQQEAKINTSPAVIYSLLVQESDGEKFVSAAGSSSKIDVCSDFKYKNFSMTFT